MMQDTLKHLGLLSVFPYLSQGLVLGRLAPVDQNPSECFLVSVPQLSACQEPAVGRCTQ